MLNFIGLMLTIFPEACKMEKKKPGRKEATPMRSQMDTSPPARFSRLSVLGFGWEKSDPSRILQSFVREHYRIHYITSGSGYLEVNGLQYRLTEGYGFIIYPGEASSYYPDKHDPWEYFWLGVRGESMQELLDLASLSRSSPLFKITNSRADARANLVNIYSSIINPQSLEEPTCFYLQTLFSNILPVIRGRHSKSYYFEKSLHYIHENYRNDIQIGDIASALAIDRTYLYKMFMNNIHCSPQAYLINHRIAKACELLISTDRNISDIAFSVGFSDLSNFCKQFRKRNEMSPKKFREISKINSAYRRDIYF